MHKIHSPGMYSAFPNEEPFLIVGTMLPQKSMEGQLEAQSYPFARDYNNGTGLRAGSENLCPVLQMSEN